MKTIEDVINNIQIFEPVAHKNVEVSFLSYPNQQNNGTTINWDEGLILKVLEVTEIDGGTVSELSFYNSSIVPIFCPEGAIFVGMNQSRALRVSSLIGSRQTIQLPVHCVEASRWRSQSIYGQGSPFCLYSRLRAMNLRHTGHSLRSEAGYESEASQSESWQEIRRMKQQRERQTGRDIQSPEEFVGDLYQDDNESIEDFISNLECPDDAVGHIIKLDSHIITAEIFGSTKLFARNYGGVMAGIALQASDQQYRQELHYREPMTVQQFLSSIEVCRKDSFKSLGMGTDIRIETNRLLGAGLVHDDKLIHLEVFAQ